LAKTKSGKGRDVPIKSRVRDVLQKLQKKSLSGFLFPHPRTSKPRKDIKHGFDKACE
jgi:hypothetical protein